MKTLHRVLENVLGISIGLLFLLVLFQVVARVVLHIPTSWSVELGRVFFSVIVFFGSAVLIYENRHMKITTVYDVIPGVLKKIVIIIANFLTVFFLIGFVWGSYTRAVRNMRVVIPTLEWMTVGHLYLLFMLSGLLMLVFTVSRLVKLLQRGM